MGRRRRRLPWGSLILGVLCMAGALWALVAIPGAANGDRGSFVATPAQVVMPATPTPILTVVATSTATGGAAGTATPGR